MPCGLNGTYLRGVGRSFAPILELVATGSTMRADMRCKEAALAQQAEDALPVAQLKCLFLNGHLY